MTRRFGIGAAGAAAFFAIAYGIPQLMQVAGLLAEPLDRILIFAPSLALAPSFVLAMAAVREWAPRERRVLGTAALSLAVMYAVLVSIVYIVQLGVVIPLDLAGEGERIALLACCGQFQPMTAIDLLGYTLMSLSTGFAAPLFEGAGSRRVARLSLRANALLAPALVLQLAWPQLIAIGALWLVTFPLAMLAIMQVFRSEPARDAVFTAHIEIG